MARPMRLASLACWLLALPAGAVWNIEDVDTGRIVWGTSMAIDAQLRPAVAFGDDDLYLARLGAAGWSVESVDRLACSCSAAPSLAFDPAGEPAIAYCGGGAGDLRLARKSGGAWRIATVASTGSVRDPSLVFDPAGNPRISYGVAGKGLRLASWDGTRWDVATVDAAAIGGRSSLAIDGAGRPAIAYSFGGPFEGLRYASWNGTGWDIEEFVPVAFQGSPLLKFDPTGAPVILFQEEIAPDVALKLARRVGASWSVEVIDQGSVPDQGPGGYCLSVDSQGSTVIGYSGYPNRDLRLATRDGTGWRLETVDATAEVQAVSVASTPSGDVFLGYDDDRAVRIAHRVGSGWKVDDVLPGLGSVGEEPSLRFDRTGRAGIAYWDRYRHRGILKLARWTGGSWGIEPVVEYRPDIGADVAFDFDASLDFGPDGRPAISFAEYGDDAPLIVARDTAQGWSRDVVDPTPAGGSSLRFAPDGNPAVSYVASTLRYASWDGSAWRLEDVLAPGLDVGPTALGFAQGEPIISFVDMNGVQVARRSAGTWTVEVVEPGPMRDPSLVVDPAGDLHLSYWDWDTGAIRYARRSAGSWSIETAGSGFAFETSIALDAAGQPRIAYADSNRGQLLLARRTGPTWSEEVLDDFCYPGLHLSLAVGPAGIPAVAYHVSGLGDLRLATSLEALQLYRGEVAVLDPGWQGASLPLGSGNDSEVAPFPAPATVPGSRIDALPGSAPLVLYRLLGPGDTPAGNRLSLVKDPGGTRAGF